MGDQPRAPRLQKAYQTRPHCQAIFIFFKESLFGHFFAIFDKKAFLDFNSSVEIEFFCQLEDGRF